MFRRVPGTKDILSGETDYWQKIEETSRNIFSLYNYKEIRTPLIEDATLFNRSLGEFSEVIQKQMFLIHHGHDVYALRPEGTASIARAYIENNLDKKEGFLKLYYIGPMFRLERPQKGRLRQFHHIGCEAIGSAGPDIDIEVISLASAMLQAYQVYGYKIKINSLGCAKDKIELAAILKRRLSGKTNNLCDECRKRFENNILRILDCKNESCRTLVNALHIGDSHLCNDCKLHFNAVKNGLDILGINYEVVGHLVRGLDYYTRTVFEISHNDLGSQDALCAGGRYDKLVSELGGPDVGAIGFAFGVERLLLVANIQVPKDTEKKLTYVITLGEEARPYGLKLLKELRKTGIPADTDYEGRSLKGAMRVAGDLKARYVVIIGENELKKKTVMLKDMVSGKQNEVSEEKVVGELASLLR